MVRRTRLCLLVAENLTETAKAVLILDAIHSGNPYADVSEPPVSLVEEARRVMLERG
jgi:hypothetical protein